MKQNLRWQNESNIWEYFIGSANKILPFSIAESDEKRYNKIFL